MYCWPDIEYNACYILVVVGFAHDSGNRSRLGQFQHRLESIKPHSYCCISSSRTMINLRKDQDRCGCARIYLDPKAGTKRRVVAGISVIIAVHSKAWRGLFFDDLVELVFTVFAPL
jgi:hypothetical protein